MYEYYSESSEDKSQVQNNQEKLEEDEYSYDSEKDSKSSKEDLFDQNLQSYMLFQSNAFAKDENLLKYRKQTVKINSNLTRLEWEIYQAIKYDDYIKLADLVRNVDLNFKIGVGKNIYHPLHLAAALGVSDCVAVILKNRDKVDIDIIEEKSGTNAFWIAAYYGRG